MHYSFTHATQHYHRIILIYAVFELMKNNQNENSEKNDENKNDEKEAESEDSKSNDSNENK